MLRVALTCHPSTPCASLGRIDARVRLAHDGALFFTFAASGDASRLLLPEPRPAARVDGLWEHTCFEAFIRARGAAYYELNWSPSNEWAIYRFDDNRRGMTVPDIARAPTICLTHRAFGIELNATISLSEIPELLATARLEMALAAVIEERDGRRSYWAVAHPLSKPDFHHPGGFVLELAQSLLARAGAAR